MAEEAPSPEEMVPSFLHAFMWASAFGAVEEFRATRFWSAGGLLFAAGMFHIVGIKWPQIKPRIGSHFASFIERIASRRLYRRLVYSAIVIALLVSIGLGAYRRYHRKPNASAQPPVISPPSNPPPSAPPKASPSVSQDQGKPQKPAKPPENSKPQLPPPLVGEIKSLRIVLRTTWTHKPGAIISEGDKPFAWFPNSGNPPLADFYGPQGTFALDLIQTLNVYVQEDNLVIITNRYVLPQSSDLIGRPVSNLRSMSLRICPFVLPDMCPVDQLKFGEATVFVNDQEIGFVSGPPKPSTATCFDVGVRQNE